MICLSVNVYLFSKTASPLGGSGTHENVRKIRTPAEVTFYSVWCLSRKKHFQNNTSSTGRLDALGANRARMFRAGIN